MFTIKYPHELGVRGLLPEGTRIPNKYVMRLAFGPRSVKLFDSD